MRRQRPVSVKVKAPSRGLLTRWPSETADLMGQADLKRVCVVAQNMRFEDGVMCAAPGYKRVHLSTSLLTNIVAHWKFEEASGTRYDSVGASNLGEQNVLYPTAQVVGKLSKAAYFVPPSGSLAFGFTSGVPGTFFPGSFSCAFWFKMDAITSDQDLLNLTELSNLLAGNGAARVYFETANHRLRFGVLNGPGSYDYVSSANGSVAAGTWYLAVCTYDGVNAVLYLNNVATSAAHALYGNSGTSASVKFANGTNLLAFAVDSASLWTRALSAGDATTLYNSGNGLDYPFLGGRCSHLFEGNLIGATTRPLVLAVSNQLYSGTRSFSDPDYTLALASIFTGSAVTAGYDFRAVDFYDKIVFAQKDNIPQFWKASDPATTVLPGLAVNSTDKFSAVSDGNEKWQGVESFGGSGGHLLFWRDDLLLWSDLNDFGNYIPVGTTIASATLTTTETFTQPAVGAQVDGTVSGVGNGLAVAALPVKIFAGQYVRLIFTTGGVAYYNYCQVTVDALAAATTIKMKLLGTTGRYASGSLVSTAQTITTLDANEAGSAQIVGSNANGPIFRVISTSDYAFIFKEWSIGSLQYVGQSQGVFSYRTEVTREGLLSKNAAVNLGNGSVVFLGHRELYAYHGGPSPTAVCRQYTRQLFTELDRSRLDEISLFHREHRNEVWVVYPVIGGQKVLIWNYVEDTASLDEYDASVQGLLRAVRLGWPVDPPWASEPVDLTWALMSDALPWSALVTGGTEELFMVACGNGSFFLHNQNVYNRDGAAYTALAETLDYDFGDNTVFKYVDVVHVGIQVLANDNQTRTLYVQVGGKTALDGDITWSAAQAINVKGAANFTTKVNPGGSGRYLRLRFYSQDADVQWRVSSFEVYARAGGTY